ncbi:MAG TPA: GNAT family N-acetyltransferase [Minicystis sp.]|nr:GNAT family N-acetyltransferase [Minicystis sp.]
MQIEVRAHASIAAIPERTWDALSGVDEAPFLSWAFLDALERTGCVGERAGWIPHHLTLHEGGELVAAAPAYLKTNSDGEFVFDWGWAGASERANIPYYPKLVVAVPFTPATAARLLVAPGRDRARLSAALAEALRAIVEAEELSGAHVLFPPEADARALVEAGMLHRYGLQFQWQNAGYATFDDFLARFSSKRRNQIKRERREMDARGVRIETIADAIRPEHVDAMYGFYASTVDKFTWGRHYLNRAFFEQIVTVLRGKVEIVLATHEGRYVGGAFNLAGPRALFGRYWGCSDEIPFLHFNVCFYHSIEACIRRGLERFEPGAGGRHKLARGFEPTVTHSTHHLRHPGLRRAVAEFLERERAVQLASAEQKSLAWR